MKNLLPLIALASAATAADYENQIIQQNYFMEDGKQVMKPYSIDVDIAGARNAPAPLNAAEGEHGRAEFTLVTTNMDTGDMTIVDEKTVGSYQADCTLRIVGPSEDTRNTDDKAVHYTRIDQGYNYEMTVTGLLKPDVGIPEAASSLLSRVESYVFAEGQEVKGAEQTYDSYLDKNVPFENGMNGKTMLKEVTKEDIEKRAHLYGLHEHVIYMKPDAVVSHISELHRASIMVWPVGTGSLSGITPGATYRTVPPLTVNVENIYPSDDSSYFVYLTGGNLSGDLTELPHELHKVTTSLTPETATHVISNIGQRITEDGTYHLTLYKTTPFEVNKQLDRVSFKVERSIKIKGNITTTE